MRPGCPYPKAWFSGFSLNDPADPNAIAEFEQSSGITLPESYRNLLLYTDGGGDLIGEHGWLILHSVAELKEHHADNSANGWVEDVRSSVPTDAGPTSRSTSGAQLSRS